ncbi:hypothetical protein HHL22_12370 [Hymenobacter sp. RP-2-7]|uniref:Uncharacterized protein n=1 Tax=Hymenobacter polaris TaxID=2682546 RepID=A0A7Y0FN13_9BACT|nr:hypothetical protein [Hymenobacter polaris]NML66000.1 hypothetical protein [Hymenobacter polaris]
MINSHLDVSLSGCFAFGAYKTLTGFYPVAGFIATLSSEFEPRFPLIQVQPLGRKAVLFLV